MNTAEVRRDEDWELMGYIRRDGEQWDALTVFGGLLSRRPSEDEARHTVELSGLSAMAEPWWVRIGENWWPCQLQEARPTHVRLWVTDHDYPGPTSAVELEHPSADVLRLHPPRQR